MVWTVVKFLFTFRFSLFTFHLEIQIGDWKSESVTNGRATRDWKSESVTNQLTWVGARDTCVSKNVKDKKLKRKYKIYNRNMLNGSCRSLINAAGCRETWKA